MKYEIVKFTTDHDLNSLPVSEHYWHGINPFGDTPRTLCKGDAFGKGESDIKYELKKTKFGAGVDCPHCISIINYFKDFKL